MKSNRNHLSIKLIHAGPTNVSGKIPTDHKIPLMLNCSHRCFLFVENSEIGKSQQKGLIGVTVISKKSN